MTLETHSQKDGKDLLVVIVDISGSMARIATDAEGGLNTFINEQKELPRGLDLLLIEFDERYIKHDLLDVNDFKSYTLQARGMTALYDAIGKAIHDVEAINVTGKTIINIMTDGAENSSKEYTHQAIKELIECKQLAGWEFIFSGANIDAIAVATSIGISGQSAMTFAASGAGVGETYAASSNYVKSVRGGDKLKAIKDLEQAKAESSNLS